MENLVLALGVVVKEIKTYLQFFGGAVREEKPPT